MPNKKTKKVSFSKTKFNKTGLFATMIIFAAIGVVALVRSYAASGTIKVSAEPVEIVNVGNNASNWVVTKDGGVFSVGTTKFYGSMGGKTLNKPISDFAKRPQSDGYWLLGDDGGLFTFGAAKHLGGPKPTSTSTGYRAIVNTPSGAGYWIIMKGGQIFAYGDAVTLSKTASSGFPTINASKTKSNTAYGGLPGLPANGIVEAAATGSGRGLILLSDSGGVYTYGDAVYRGGAGTLASGVYARDVAAFGSGNSGGYYITTNKGKVIAKNVTHRGDASGLSLARGITGFACTPGCNGYWLLGLDGGIFAYGDAKFVKALEAPKPTTTTTTTTTSNTNSTTTTIPKLTEQDIKYITAVTAGVPNLTAQDVAFITAVTAGSTPTTVNLGGGASNNNSCPKPGGSVAVCDVQRALNAYFGENLVVDGIPGKATWDACGRHPGVCGGGGGGSTPMPTAASLGAAFAGSGSFGSGSYTTANATNVKSGDKWNPRSGLHTICWSAYKPISKGHIMVRANYSDWGGFKTGTETLVGNGGNGESIAGKSNGCRTFATNSTHTKIIWWVKDEAGSNLAYAFYQEGGQL